MSNYRLAYVTTLYPEAISYCLKSRTDFSELDYAKAQNAFTSMRIGYSDYHSRYLGLLGNECKEFFFNFIDLQEKWMFTSKSQHSEKNHEWNILISQLKNFKPDVVYLADLYVFDFEKRRELRKLFKKAKIIGWRFAPTSDFGLFSDLDLLLTGNKEWRGFFRNYMTNVEWIPIGFEKGIINQLGNEKISGNYNLTFLGSIGSRNGPHSKRYHLIETLLKKTPIVVWSKNVAETVSNANKRFLKKIIIGIINTLKYLGIINAISRLTDVNKINHLDSNTFKTSVYESYKERIHDPVFGLEYYRVIASSSVTFNHHIDVLENSVGNMRMFEATGLGSCLLTDLKPELNEFFEPDEEIVTYNSIDEAIEKFNYLLNNPETRKKISRNGQQRTLNNYTMKHHVEQLHNYVVKYLFH